MKRILLSAVFTMSFILTNGRTYDTLYISTLHTTHLIFEDELTYVDISNKVIAAKVAENNRQVLAIKAKEKFNFTATISTLGSTGEMNTFIVLFRETPETLIIDKRRSQSGHAESNIEVRPYDGVMQKKLHHIADKRYGIEILCDNIFVDRDVTGVVISIENQSGVSYASEGVMFVLENRRKSKRKPLLEKPVFPVRTSGMLSAGPGQKASVVHYFDKLSLTKDRVMKAYIYESGGTRHYTLELNHNDINKAEVLVLK